MSPQTLRTLLAGNYICSVAFPFEWEDLMDTETQAKVEEWLMALDMRLARLGDMGAFFLAPNVVRRDDQMRVREELRKYRDVYGPAFQMLDMIRQAKPESVELRTGDYVQLVELEALVIASASLEKQLNAMNSVNHKINARNSIRDRVEKLLEALRAEGYLCHVNASTGSYRITGKIEQLDAVLEFLAMHIPALDTEVEDADEEPDLIDQLNMEGIAENAATGLNHE